MKTGIIYEWRNKLDGKFYVGQTIRPKERYNEHVKANSDSVFHRAIRLHGIENFEYTVVATYQHETKQGLYDLLNEAEKERIKFRNSIAPNGYNVAEGGGGCNTIAGMSDEEYADFITAVSCGVKKFFKEHPEAIQLQSDIKKQYFSDNKNREKTSIATKKAMDNDITRKKISDGVKKRYDDAPDTFGFSGHKHSDDSNERNRQSHLNKKLMHIGNHQEYVPVDEIEQRKNEGWELGDITERSDDWRKKQSDSKKGNKNASGKRSPETCKKISDSKKGKPAPNKGKPGKTKGQKLMHIGNHQEYVSPDLIEQRKSEGWELGACDEFKKMRSETTKGKSPGNKGKHKVTINGKVKYM